MGLNGRNRDDLRILGNKLKLLRKSKGLTLKELGYRINKDPQSISRVEMGGINPTYLYLVELSKGLEIELPEIFKDLDWRIRRP